MNPRLRTNYFYDIAIYDREKKRRVTLPDYLRKSLDSVVVNLVINSETQMGNTCELEFKEQHVDGITLNPGYICDLRFTGQNGLAYVSSEDLQKGFATRKVKQNNKEYQAKEPIVFLLDTGNYIEITWGYRNPYKSRSMIFKLVSLTSVGGASGHGTVKVTGADASHEFRELQPERGLVFERNGKAESLGQMLYRISKSNDLELRFDGNDISQYPPDVTNGVESRYQDGVDVRLPGNARILPRTITLDTYLANLARDTYSIYTIEHIKENGKIKQILNFQSMKQKFSDVKYSFTYNDSQTDVLSYTVSSAFTATNAASSANTGTGEEGSDVWVDDQFVEGIKDSKDRQSPGISKTTSVKASKELGVKLAGKSVTAPDKDIATNQATKNSILQNFQNSISIETIGDPDYGPCSIRMNNIGARFSTQYRMLSVSHKLTNSGFTCSWAGISQLSGETGSTRDDATNENETQNIQFIK